MNRTVDRRTFLGLTTAGAAALLTTDRLAAEEKAVFPIIDTHQHLWDLDKFKLPWLERVPALDKSYRPDDYRKAAAEVEKAAGMPPARVVKTVYMEVDVTPEQQQAEADYVVDLCRRGDTPMTAAVISGRPASENFARYIRPFRDSKYVKGVRQVLHVPETPAGYCLGKEFVKGIQLLGELGLSFDLCMRAADLPNASRLIDACPGTSFILDHCGNANVQAKDRTQWQRDLADLARRKNVVGKISGIVASAKPEQWTAADLAPIVNHTLDSFGPERVVFGGDWPVCTLAASLAQWVTALRHIVRDRKAEEQRKLFHDNAIRVYRLG